MLKQNNRAWLYLAPAFILIAVFFLWPLINAFVLAFTYEGQVTLENFTYVLHDPIFWESLKNTTKFVLAVIPATTIISLALAMALHSKLKGTKVFETIFFLPYVTSAIAIGISWQLMFHTDYGTLNNILTTFGFEAVPWLSSQEFAMLSVIIFGIWRGLAFNIIILLTGLRQIDQDLYRASSVDGASKWQQFKSVTLPQLNPTITFVVLIGMIHAFKVYNEVVALFGTVTAGPGNSATTIVYYIYDAMYTKFDYNLAAAASVILLIIILLFTLLQSYVTKKIGERY